MRRKNSTPPDRGQEDQSITVGGLGTKGADYKTRVRAVTHDGVQSEWTNEVQFTLTDSTEGTATDPNLPGIPTNLVLIPMLNMILVKFDDEWAGSNPLMSHNAGLYEIQISNATGGSPDWTDASTANEWTQTIGTVEAGDDSTARKKYMVPDGQGFLCAGLKSEKTTPTGGRTHYVRVRGVNAHGSVHTTGDGWSTVDSVNLDLENKAQTGTVISDGAIYTEHIGAATIRGTNIFGGTINATEMNANQIYATGIALPSNSSPSHAGDHGDIDGVAGEPYAFNIDIDGNMWWGDYDTIGAAITGADKSYITAAGNATFVGEISTDTDGNPRIVIGDNSTDVGIGGSAGGYGYLLGYTEDTDENIPGHAVFTTEGSGSSKYGAAYFVAPRYHSGWKYAGVRLRDPKVHESTSTETNGEAVLVHPADMDYMGLVRGPRSEGGSAYGTAYSEVMGVVTAPGGLRITGHNVAPGTPGGLTLDSGTPATGSTDTGSNRDKLWNDGGTIMWGATDLTSGGSGSTNFLPTTQSGSNLASVSVSGDDVTISAVKTITTTSDTGFKGIAITSADQANTGVKLNLNGLDLGTPSAGTSDYVPWSRIQSGTGSNTAYRVSMNNFATFIAGRPGLASTDFSSVYMAATTIASTYLTSAAASVTYLALAGGTMTGGTINGPTGSGIVIQGSASQSGNLRANAGSSKGIEVQSGGSVKIYNGTDARIQTAATYNAFYQQSRGITGTAADPAWSFTTQTGTGLYTSNIGTGTIKFAANGTQFANMTSGQLQIVDGTLAAPAYSFLLNQSSGMADVGYYSYLVHTGSYKLAWNATNMYVRPTSGAGDYYLKMSSTWQMSYSSSAERYKERIETVDASDALTRIKALRPVEFYFKTDVVGDSNGMTPFQKQRGFIADEVAEVDHWYSSYCWYQSDDAEDEGYTKIWAGDIDSPPPPLDEAKPAAWHSDAVVADLVSVVQTLEARIAVLEG